MNITLSGFDDFKRQVEKLQENVEKLEEKYDIPFDELFPTSFISSVIPTIEREEV